MLPLLPGAGAAAGLLLIAGLLDKRLPRVAWPLAGLAFFAGNAVTWLATHDGMPHFTRASSGRMLWALGIVGLLGGATELLRGRPALRRSLHCLLAGGLVWFLLFPLLQRDPESASHVGKTEALCVIGGVLAFWWVADGLASAVKGPALPLGLGIVFSLAGQVFVTFGSASLAQLFGTAGIALFGAGALARLWPEGAFPRAALGGVTAVAAGVGLDGWYYMTDPPPAPALGLLAIAPAALFAMRLRRVQAMRAPARLGLTLALVVVVAGIGLAVAILEAPPPDPYADFK